MCTPVCICVYSYPSACGWVVNKSLQLISDENRMQFTEIGFFMEWTWKLGKIREYKYRGKEKKAKKTNRAMLKTRRLERLEVIWQIIKKSLHYCFRK